MPWNDRLSEAGNEVALCSPVTKGMHNGAPKWAFNSAECQHPASGNSPVCVETGVPRRCPEKVEQREAKTYLIPARKIEASFCRENHFCLKHQPEIIAYLLAIDS